jgi:hypothetical protein
MSKVLDGLIHQKQTVYVNGRSVTENLHCILVMRAHCIGEEVDAVLISLEAKKTCKAKGRNATLIIANENVLRHIHPFAFHKMVELNPERSEKGTKIVSIDVFFLARESVIVWSVKEEGAIYFQKVKREKRQATPNFGLLLGNLVEPHGISVDWISKNTQYHSAFYKRFLHAFDVLKYKWSCCTKIAGKKFIDDCFVICIRIPHEFADQVGSKQGHFSCRFIICLHEQTFDLIIGIEFNIGL